MYSAVKRLARTPERGFSSFARCEDPRDSSSAHRRDPPLAHELLEQVDPQQFVRIHRSIIVNLNAVERIERDVLGRTEIHLKSHKGVLPVSRAFAGPFKRMERLACLAIRLYRLA